MDETGIIQDLQEYVKDTYENRRDMIKTKKSGLKYVLPQDRENFVMCSYVILLLKKSIKILKAGHSSQELMQALTHTNWIRYSFNSHAYWREKDLVYYLAITKKSYKITELLEEQGKQLEKAAYIIADFIELKEDSSYEYYNKKYGKHSSQNCRGV